MRHRPNVGLLALLGIALAACSGGGPTSQRQTWTGTSTVAGVAHPLELRATLTPGGVWAGAYRLDRTPPFTGAVDARFADGTLTGVVVVSDACRFALAGQRTGDEIVATFLPTDCPGGVGGAWRATLASSTPGATPPEPIPDEETFDGGAAFDVAHFR
jgi:hypothetical protein